MKSRTSYFNATVLKKDITRFAPAWALYTVYLLLTIPRLAGADRFAQAVGESISLMFPVNLVYALLCGELLFGDLFQSRLCNALHAMPLRREGWFLTHLTAGLLFSLVPNLFLTLLCLPLLGGHGLTALLWLGAVMLEFLFFFSLAIMSAMCVGSRFAMATVYAMVNFLGIILYYLTENLYAPLLNGIVLDTSLFAWLSPVVKGVGMELVHFEVLEATADGAFLANAEPTYVMNLGQGWDYLFLLGGLALALLALALFLYRRRDLENAGDFITVKPLAPVFLILYTLSAAVSIQVVFSLFDSDSAMLLVLVLGLAVGYCTGQMLLRRTVRVFRPKVLLGLGVFALALCGSMVLVWLDPMGVTRWVPEQNEVDGVYLECSEYAGITDAYLITDEAVVRDILALHKGLTRNDQFGREGDSFQLSSVKPIYGTWRSTTITLRYELKNGRTVRRTYAVRTNSPEGVLLAELISTPEYLIQRPDWADYCRRIQTITFCDQQIDTAQLPQLMEAIRQDCLEGNMIQCYAYHAKDGELGWMEITLQLTGLKKDEERGRCLTIYDSSTQTVTWLKENGYLDWDVNDPETEKFPEKAG